MQILIFRIHLFITNLIFKVFKKFILNSTGVVVNLQISKNMLFN